MIARLKALQQRILGLFWVLATLRRAGLIGFMSPRTARAVTAVYRRDGATPSTPIGLSAARWPDAVGMIDERGPITWGELEANAEALAAAIGEGGTPEVVAILCRNHRGFVEALRAAGRLGADAVMLNTGFSGPQLRDILLREGAQALLYDEEFDDLVAQARDALPGLREVLVWTDTDLDDRETVDALVQAHRGRRPPVPSRRGRAILLTSGTTGTPKGARSSTGGARTLAAMFDRIPWRSCEPVVVAAPMFHGWGFGQLSIAATLGCTIITHRRFDPEDILRLVDEYRATGLVVVPVMLERIVDLPDDVLSKSSLASLRFVTASGSRMRPDSVIAFMDRFGDIVHNSYNSTEAGMITIATPADLRDAPDTGGRPVAGTDLLLLDDRGDEVPLGQVGRIAVRSATLFQGYTAGDERSFYGEFMVSGDVGRFDAKGRLSIVGRDDEMIVSGGENVYPFEVEHLLSDHPEVKEAAVVGVDDDAFGQRLSAFVVRSPGATITSDELKQHVKQRLAGYKVPREFTFLDELPRNASGKVVKRELRPVLGDS